MEKERRDGIVKGVIGVVLLLLILGYVNHFSGFDTAEKRMVIGRDFSLEYPGVIIIQLQPNVLATKHNVIGYSEDSLGIRGYYGEYWTDGSNITDKKLFHRYLPNMRSEGLLVNKMYSGE